MEARRFHAPTSSQLEWIEANYDVHVFGRRLNYLYIETDNPPDPVPLTLACMPILFVGKGEPPENNLPNAGHYANPRITDPCPNISWPKLSNPKRAQQDTILATLGAFLNMKGILFLPSLTVVELIHDDNRIYAGQSLPGIVAGRTTLYHHSETPFFHTMRDLKRERRLDPARYDIPMIGPLLEDSTNYLSQPASLLTPGVRLSSGRGAPGTLYENASRATSAGVRLRNSLNHREVITVANHGFLFSDEVYHPSEEDGDRVGDVVGRRPELDIALVKLTPSETSKFSNRVYFQAEPPKRLVSGDDVEQGLWAEVDGMSSGLVSLLCEGVQRYKPERPPGHPKISMSDWQSFHITQIFGAVNDRMVDGMCGAPIVGCETGHVLGFFHLGSGCHARCATLDDLIAEGWAMV